MNINSICEQCGLYRYSSNPQIKGKGSPSPRLVLIGEAPGSEEAKQGQVFVGRAGKKLHKMLVPYFNLGIWITNAVKCFPPLSTLNPSKGFRVPKIQEIKHCQNFLYPELEAFNPTPVLMPLGNTALYALTGGTDIDGNKIQGITKKIGIPFKDILNSIWFTIIPNYHPSYILRNPKMESEFIRVMEIAKEYINANS